MKFENSLIVSVKKARHKRLFILQEPLVCIDGSGRTWIVPTGFATDFASIPAAGRVLISKAHQNAYAAVLHDYLYETQPIPRDRADALFREALASPDCNTGTAKQWLMYAAVRSGGWRSWNKIKTKSTKSTEANLMADNTVIDDEDDKNAFFEWVKKLWKKTDRELDELDDVVRARATRLFRSANWPGVRDREALYQKKVKKSLLFKVGYALVFLSSCITLYYWWGAMPDLTSKLLIGIGFFTANLLMPVWARMTFWQGGTWLQPFVNLTGLAIFVSVSAASIVASAGLQGTKSDEMRSIRTQQSVEFKASIEEAKQRASRLSELRSLTTRTPAEINAELNGLLVTEPKPQSACNSREGFGAWSKRNCSTVANLRVEISRAEERVRLEQLTAHQNLKEIAPVSSVDPQFEIAKRYLDVDRPTFNRAKPLILAILLEMIFNMLTVLLTITFGAEVREELNERIRRLKSELINQAENEHTDEQEAVRLAEQRTNADTLAREAEAAKTEASIVEKVQAIMASQNTTEPENREIVTEAPEAAHPTPPTTLEDVSEPELPLEAAPAVAEVATQIPDVTVTPTTAVVVESQAEPTSTVIQESDVRILEAPIGEQVEKPSDIEQRNADLEAQVLTLKWENLVSSRATAGDIRVAAEYALARLISSTGQKIALSVVWKDFSAWCSITGKKEPATPQDFLDTLVSGLGLTTSDENSVVILNGVTLQGV